MTATRGHTILCVIYVREYHSIRQLQKYKTAYYISHKRAYYISYKRAYYISYKRAYYISYKRAYHIMRNLREGIP